MKKIHKRLISLLLSFCLIFSMVWVSSPPVSAGVGTVIGKAVAKKAMELGIRAACKVSTELAAQAENDNASIVLNSFIGLILMDGQGVTVNKISKMCEDILKELAELEEDVKNYTSAISSAIDKQNTANIKAQFQEKWQSDVTDVLKDHRVDKALSQYVKYMIIAHVKTNGMPTGDLHDKLMNFWNTHFGGELDVSEEALNTAKADLEKAFLSIYDSSNPQNSKDKAYHSAYIYNEMTGAINELVYNYTHSGIGDNAYSVVDCAATDAYYVLPFSHQQYEYVTSVAKKQIMVVSMMELALNEYLSMQGQYLDAQSSNDSWATSGLDYKTEGGTTASITYEQCKENYQGLLEADLIAATKLLESDVRINTTAYTGVAQDLTLNLSSYMRAEDATKVTLKINGYAEKHDYKNEIADSEADNGVHVGNTVSKVSYVTKELVFYRVMSGGQVYYILDSTQFSNANALGIGCLKDSIQRWDFLNHDLLVGDLYPVSNEYLNLIKTFSDGANAFSVPSASDITTRLAPLVKVPSFSAYSGFSLQTHLAGYLPTGVSGNTYILTSSYKNNFNKGTNIAVKYAEINLVNAGDILDNTYTVAAKAVSTEDFHYKHKYSVILANNDNVYNQNANLKAVDSAGSVEDFYFTKVGNGSRMEAGSTHKCQSGSKYVIRFKLENAKAFDSLKMIRNNTEKTETVLIDGANDLQYFLNATDGYYEFEFTMPYSDVSFVLETKTPGGDFLIENYEDLCQMAIDVNSGDRYYVNGTYTLVNDIDCSTGDYSARSIIGTSTVHFNGTFNGNGHTISNLNYGATADGSKHGLFGVLGEDAVVRDLIVSDATVWSDNSIVEGSGVIAKQNDGLITSCLVIDSSVQLGNWANLGGIVGRNNGTISNCGIANSHLTRRWGGSSDGNMGGITEVNDGKVMNCFAYNCTYNNGTSNRGALVGSGNGVQNSYYYTTSSVNSIGVKKDVSAFTSGEVTYLLNNGVTDNTQVWYQDIDNGEPIDDYPVFTAGTVYKVNREDKIYSNYLIYEDCESVLSRSDLRTYQRIILGDHTLSDKSQIAYGYGLVDNENKVITVYMASTAERMGILMHQGKDGEAGILRLMGNYPKYDKTSAEILAAGEKEPPIYIDGNGCIFIKAPTDGSQIPELTVSYTQKPTSDYDATLYTLKVQTIDVSYFAQIGGTITNTLDKNDPDYDVVHGTNQEELPETGDVSIACFAVIVLCCSMIIVTLVVLRKKEDMA